MADDVERFLAAFDPAVQQVALAARDLVLRIAPDAHEEVHRAWKTIAYGRARKFCAISPHKAWVNLQLHRGAALPDPADLLEGTGRSMRHVKLKTKADLKQRELATLLRAAAREAR